MVLTSLLNFKNTTRAINTFATTALSYSFGVLSWSKTDLESLDALMKTEMTAALKRNRYSSIERVYLPKEEGGMGLLSISDIHNNEIAALRSYFFSRSETSRMHRIVCSADVKLTPLNLHDQTQQSNETITTTQMRMDQWRAKAMHGQHAHDLDRPNVDKKASNAWLMVGELYPETVGSLLAIQDQVVPTRYYLKRIANKPDVSTELCRRCKGKPETIKHIIGECSNLAPTEYTNRHNQVARIIHQRLAEQCGFLQGPLVPYYKYSPSAVLESSEYRLYYDRTILTDKTIRHNRPDILLENKQNKEVYLLDIAVPNTQNIEDTITQKSSKYVELAEEILRLWGYKKYTIIPLVLSNTGVIPKNLLEGLKLLNLPDNLYILLQRSVILSTCHMVRSTLNLKT